MNTQQRIQLMQERLTQTLHPTQLDIIDDSHLHIGHEGAKSGAGHFTIQIAALAFKDKSLVECHRMIYQSLNDLIGPEIHALKIDIRR